jgi:hypothetical protein
MQEIEPAKAKPEFVEEHPFDGLIIEMEFYKLPDGRYKLWPYVKRAQGDGTTKIHFVLAGEFDSAEAARAAGMKAGQEKIRAEFDTSSST